ncbi:Coq4 family protein [Parasphingorhabdus sp.]|uniref:Coq4 family protein n=1 Tax=Parasphingorhabdus sp. TaxID=2709688 RepID=UPI003A910847
MKIDHKFSTPTDSQMPFVHPERPAARFRPLKALHHFRELIKDKEDTEQVFHIFEALPRPGFRKDARKFVESDKGRALLQNEPELAVILDDHDRLRQMPAGSLAHAYCDFMEKEGLSAAGLIAEYDQFSPRKYGDLIEWYGFRQRDTHDLLHVLTGYGRDALGEACVLAFTYGQNPALGNVFIAYAAGLNMKKQVKGDVPIFKAIREAQKMGKACPKITDESILDLLAQPLDALRERLHIQTPHFYHQAHRQFRALNVDPYDMLAQAA